MERKMNTRQDIERARQGILQEINGLIDQRRGLMARQQKLKAGKPKRGYEALVNQSIKRYGSEIAEINRRIGMLEANLEGLA